MNTIPFPKPGDPEDERDPSQGLQESIRPQQPEKNIADGGEFLDDGIRMKDQPLGDNQKTNFLTTKNSYYEMY